MFGPTLLSEGVLKQVADARTRLLAPKSTTVPAVGMQYATLIESEQLMQISAVCPGVRGVRTRLRDWFRGRRRGIMPLVWGAVVGAGSEKDQ